MFYAVCERHGEALQHKDFLNKVFQLSSLITPLTNLRGENQVFMIPGSAQFISLFSQAMK